MSTEAPQTRLQKSDEHDLSKHSDHDSDSENDPLVQNLRSSVEIADHDRGLLDEEEEREKLLTSGEALEDSRGFFSKGRKTERAQNIPKEERRRKSRRSRRKKRGEKANSHDDEGELLYVMEEGGPKDDVSSQASRSSSELDKLDSARSSTSKVGQTRQ